MNRWDVVAVGENSVDVVYVLPNWPGSGDPSAKIEIRERLMLYGGQVATTAAACAALGLRTRYVGATGNDENGRGVRNELRRRGVDVAHLLERNGENRYAVILVDGSSGERLVLWHRADHLNLAADELPLDDIARARLVHVDTTDEATALRAAAAARAGGALVTTDIDRATAGTAQLLGLATHAILAEDVPRALTGTADLEAALRELRRTTGAVLIVTLGKRGAAALDGDRFCTADAFAVRAIDTTGAGDVFRGGFIDAILRDEPIDGALRFANAAAAVSCTRAGALNGVPTRDEIASLTNG